MLRAFTRSTATLRTHGAAIIMVQRAEVFTSAVDKAAAAMPEPVSEPETTEPRWIRELGTIRNDWTYVGVFEMSQGAYKVKNTVVHPCTQARGGIAGV